MTRILKVYGDALEGSDMQQGPTVNATVVSMQEIYLRCVVLLVRLTGQYVARFLPQVCTLTPSHESTYYIYSVDAVCNGSVL